MDKNPARRKLGIVCACILSGIALLYLGGLIGQLLTNYDQWLQADGPSGAATIAPLQLSPIQCFQYAFTPQGLKGMFCTLAAVGILVVALKLHNRFGSKQTDDRNFALSTYGTYGTAGWMTPKDMRSVLEVVAPAKAEGVILGQDNESVVCLPNNTRLNKHIMVIGASGTGKSRCFIRPAVLQAVKRKCGSSVGESVIITDPKGELFTDLAEFLRDQGYKVKVFNLVSPAHSDSWNCMANLHGDPFVAQVLVDAIISNTSHDKGDHFWDSGESNLLKALMLYVDLDPTLEPTEKNLSSVYQMLVQHTERQLSLLFDRLPLDHPARAPYNLFAQASDTVRAGIVLGLGTRLQALQSPAIQRLISGSSISLTAPAQQKCAYFVILSDQHDAFDFLSSLFFSMLFIELIEFADSMPDGRCPIPVNLVLDELNNLGTIPAFPRRVSSCRSRAVQIYMAIQGLGQLQNRYPNNLWAEILGNVDTQLMLGCNDSVTASFVSERSGDMTVEVESTMTVRKTIAVAQMIPQYRQSQGQGRRRLLTPDEVMRLPNDELLVMIRGQKMCKLHKFDYTNHAFTAQLRQATLSEYNGDLPTLRSYTARDEAPPMCAASPTVRAPLYGAAKPPEDF